jgi:hypothetical protein
VFVPRARASLRFASSSQLQGGTGMLKDSLPLEAWSAVVALILLLSLAVS